MTGVRVLLVDDHEMLTDALATRLSATPDIHVVGRCTTEDSSSAGAAAVAPPDVITIEVIAARDAAALLTRLRGAWPGAHIVVLTASQDPEQAIEAARAGADGWVSKESSVDAFAQVVRCASRGHACFPPEQLGPILRELRKDVARAHRPTGPLEALTTREHGVLVGLAGGHSAAEIADELGVSPNTVRSHTNKIFSKLDVHSRLEAASVARLAGINPEAAPPPARRRRDTADDGGPGDGSVRRSSGSPQQHGEGYPAGRGC
ncbi:MAG: LuxR C-terminal-related transcriptional regulator [Pseudonocardiaceae bacterium]